MSYGACILRPPKYAPPLQVVTWTATQSGLVTLTFDLLTLEVVRNVTRSTDNLPANSDVSATFRCRVMGRLASD